MAPSPITSLILRVVTFVFVLVSLIILTTNSQSIDAGTFRFNSVYAFRYTLFTMIMGVLYTLLQIAFTIYHFKMGKRLAGDGLLQFDFYGDKIISYTLATGAAAAFGASVDLHEIYGSISRDFFSKAYASASLLLFGFFCTAVSSVFSSMTLPKYD